MATALDALQLAARQGDAGLVRALLASSPGLCDRCAGSCAASSCERTRSLVARPSAPLNAALLHAATRGEYEVLVVMTNAFSEGALRAALAFSSPDSGHTALHAALWAGHFRVAALLLGCGSSLTALDASGWLPLELLASRLQTRLAGATLCRELWSWGAGTNYALGCPNRTGGHFELPGRVESEGTAFLSVSTSKFHSAAVDAQGVLWTWGWGARTGHSPTGGGSDSSAVLTPRALAGALRGETVVGVSVGKHHTLCCTADGAVFSWGSNRDGRLGLGAMAGDSVAQPRRLAAFGGRLPRVASVSCGGKHSAALGVDGRSLWTFGSNAQGQLGYGTPPDCGMQPRAVELRGRALRAVSCGKAHTCVVTVDGDVLVWGHKQVTPRRLPLPASTLGRYTSVAAGSAVSLALLSSGGVVAWRHPASAAPSPPRVHLLTATGPLEGRAFVGVAASKRRVAAWTSTGEAITWDIDAAAVNAETPATAPAAASLSASPSADGWMQRSSSKGELAAASASVAWLLPPARVPGLARVVSLAMGEKHTLGLTQLAAPLGSPFAAREAPSAPPPRVEREDAGSLFFSFEQDEREETPPPSPGRPAAPPAAPPSLKELVEESLALALTDVRTALPLADAADALQAPRLKVHCLLFALRNMDALLTAGGGAECFAATPPHLLAEMESLGRGGAGIEPLFPSSRQAPRSPSAPAPPSPRRPGSVASMLLRLDALCARIAQEEADQADAFPYEEPSPEAGAPLARALKALRKRLVQLEALEAKLRRGHQGAPLDAAQLAKLARKGEAEAQLARLERGDFSFLAEEASPSPATPSSEGGRMKKGAAAAATPPPPSPAAATPLPRGLPRSGGSARSGSAGSGGSSLPRAEGGGRASVPSPPQPPPPRKPSLVSLSLFLSGALDEAPPPSPPAESPTPPRGWDAAGGAGSSGGLRDIIGREAAAAAAAASALTRSAYASAARQPPEPPAGASSAPSALGSSSLLVPLSALLRKPTPAAAAASPWAGSPSRLASASSLPRIQAEQTRRLSTGAASAKHVTTGFELSGSPDSRWYIPSPQQSGGQQAPPASLREMMQAEERERAEAADLALALRLQAEEDAAEEARTPGRAQGPPRRNRRGRT